MRVAPYVSARLSLTDFIRTPFGCVPETLLHRLGLFDVVTKKVLSHAEPYCVKCDVTVPRIHFERAFEILLTRAAHMAGTTEVTYAAAVPEAIEIPLLEHMELLESDRAIVEGKLVRREALTEGVGSPVLAVGSNPESLKDTIQKWLTSGGGVIKVFSFSSRTSEGVELQRFSDELRCSQCGELYPEPTLQVIEELPPCSRCKGVGWFSAKDRYDTEVFHACLDCSGYGALSLFFEYRFCSVPLRDFLTLSFRELYAALSSDHSLHITRDDPSWNAVIKDVSRSPLGEYRCGTPISLLSYDERVVLTALQCLTVGYRGRTLIFDLGTLSSPSEAVRDFLCSVVAPRIAAKVIGANFSSQMVPGVPPKNAPLLHISDVTEQGVRIDHFSFPKGENTFIVGGIECAHERLLEIVHNRFLKRKKFSQTCHFEGCSEVLALSSKGTLPVLFAELIGVEEKLAHLYSNTASAQRIGLQKESFKVIRAMLDCPTCGLEREENCQSCRGELYDWRLSTVRVGSLSFQEAVQLPLPVLLDTIVLDDSTDFVLREVSKWVPESTTLGMAVSSLSGAVAPHLYLLSRLLGVYGGLVFAKQKKRIPLVLVDTPFSGISELDAEIQKTLKLLCEKGATILSAGGALRCPEHFAKVFFIRRMTHSVPSTPYFHERYALSWEPFEYSSVSG